jgi:hypothetical protein
MSGSFLEDGGGDGAPRGAWHGPCPGFLKLGLVSEPGSTATEATWEKSDLEESPYGLLVLRVSVVDS